MPKCIDMRPAVVHCSSTRAPYGYSLNMFAWYIDQTVGGAVATGTHGSSMRWGSLSSQARSSAAAYLCFCLLTSGQDSGLSNQQDLAVQLRPGLCSICTAWAWIAAGGLRCAIR